MLKHQLVVKRRGSKKGCTARRSEPLPPPLTLNAFHLPARYLRLGETFEMLFRSYGVRSKAAFVLEARQHSLQTCWQWNPLWRLKRLQCSLQWKKSTVGAWKLCCLTGRLADDLTGLLTEIHSHKHGLRGRERSFSSGFRGQVNTWKGELRLERQGCWKPDPIPSVLMSDLWPLTVSTVLVLVSIHFRIIRLHQISDFYADEPQQMSYFIVFIYSVQAMSAAVPGLLNFWSNLLEFCNTWHWSMHQTA